MLEHQIDYFLVIREIYERISHYNEFVLSLLFGEKVIYDTVSPRDSTYVVIPTNQK